MHLFFMEVEERFLNSLLKFAEAEWGVSRSPAGSPEAAAAPSAPEAITAGEATVGPAQMAKVPRLGDSGEIRNQE